MIHIYRDRHDAGSQLAEALKQHVHLEKPLVLALPRGGVPVAADIAGVLGAELDVLVVRKLGHPLQPELALGAVASGGVRVLNPEVAGTVSPDIIEAVVARATREVERRAAMYRAGRTPLAVRDRNVILVDDGLATGATMLAAVRAVRAGGAHHVIVAAPVGDAGVCGRLGREADRVLCLLQPAPSLVAVGHWYQDFPQLTDEEVTAALAAVRPLDAGLRHQL